MRNKNFLKTHLIETLKNNVVGGDDVDHEVLRHRLDLEVQADEEFLVQGGMFSNVCTVRKDPEIE